MFTTNPKTNYEQATTSPAGHLDEIELDAREVKQKARDLIETAHLPENRQAVQTIARLDARIAIVGDYTYCELDVKEFSFTEPKLLPTPSPEEFIRRSITTGDYDLCGTTPYLNKVIDETLERHCGNFLGIK